jgi:hypothetical protein
MTTTTTIDLKSTSISELKAYCLENDIVIVGDRRKRQAYVDSIEASREVEKSELTFDMIDFCYPDFLSDYHNRENEQLIGVNYYIGQTLEDLHTQVIDQLDYVYSEKMENISNNAFQYAIEVYFQELTQQDFEQSIGYIDIEDYDDDFASCFYFVFSWKTIDYPA